MFNEWKYNLVLCYDIFYFNIQFAMSTFPSSENSEAVLASVNVIFYEKLGKGTNEWIGIISDRF